MYYVRSNILPCFHKKILITCGNAMCFKHVYEIFHEGKYALATLLKLKKT